MKPLVSIILPTHNRCTLLPHAINSVLSQTYTNWELIIVADKCTDSTITLVESTYLSNSKIRLLKCEFGSGAGSRNLGLRAVQGEVLSFLDDDDVWHSQKLKVQVSVLINSPTAAIVYCDFYRVYSVGSKKKIKLRSRTSLNDLLYVNCIGSFSFAIVRKSSLGSININESLESCQDWDLWTKILANSNMEALNVDLALVDYTMDGIEKISSNDKKIISGYSKWREIHWKLMNNNHRVYHDQLLSIIRGNIFSFLGLLGYSINIRYSLKSKILLFKRLTTRWLKR